MEVWSAPRQVAALTPTKLASQGSSPLEIIREAKAFISLDDKYQGYGTPLRAVGRSLKRLPALQHLETTPKSRMLLTNSTICSTPTDEYLTMGRSSSSNALASTPQTAPSRMGRRELASQKWGEQRPKSCPRISCKSHSFLHKRNWKCHPSTPSLSPFGWNSRRDLYPLDSLTPAKRKMIARSLGTPSKSLSYLAALAEESNEVVLDEAPIRRRQMSSPLQDYSRKPSRSKRKSLVGDDEIEVEFVEEFNTEDRSVIRRWPKKENQDKVVSGICSAATTASGSEPPDPDTTEVDALSPVLRPRNQRGDGTRFDRQVFRGEKRSWKRGDLLGLGSLGMVYKGMDVDTGETIAVKEVLFDPKLDADVKFSRALQKEIDMLQTLKHDNIVSYLGHDLIEEKLYVYLEFMVSGSVAQIISNFGALDEKNTASYIRDVCKGLDFLHSRTPPLLHLDIKGANILVNDNRAKLSDFGCSKRVTDSMTHTMAGSILWMAPEVMSGKTYGMKADIWSLGCLLIEMSSAHHPWESFDNNLVAMARIAMSAEIPKIPEHLSDGCKDFTTRCLARDPDERPSAAELLKHPFLLFG